MWSRRWDFCCVTRDRTLLYSGDTYHTEELWQVAKGVSG